MNKPTIAIIVVIVLAVAVTLLQGNKYKKFMETAAKTTGRISQKEDRIADPSKAHNRKEHWLHYSYSDKAGNSYEKQDLIEYDDLWQGFRESYPLDVYYNPKNPGESYVAPVIDRRVGIASKLKK